MPKAAKEIVFLALSFLNSDLTNNNKMESEEKIETTPKMELNPVQAKQKSVKEILEAPYQVHLRNVHHNAWYAFLHEFIPKLIKSPHRVDIYGPGPRTALTTLCYANEEDAKVVIEELPTMENWDWNLGFRVKCVGMLSVYAVENGTEVGGQLDLSMKLPDYLGESWDDCLEKFKPGDVLMLPAYRHRKVGTRLDVRLERSQFGTPVVIVAERGDLVNIVLVSSLPLTEIASWLTRLR